MVDDWWWGRGITVASDDGCFTFLKAWHFPLCSPHMMGHWMIFESISHFLRHIILVKHDP
jgi:hypothetical protein